MECLDGAAFQTHDGMVMSRRHDPSTMHVRERRSINDASRHVAPRGVVLGMILMAFLAIGTYQRGYDAGALLRKPWQVELRARRQAVINAYTREKESAA